MDRVRQLRERLSAVLPLLSDAVRSDIEELLDLAAGAQRQVPAAAPPASALERSASPPRIALADILRNILDSAREPMRVRDLTEAALDQGWTTASAEPAKVVSSCLGNSDDFVAVARGQYLLRNATATARADEVVHGGARRAPERPAPLAADRDEVTASGVVPLTSAGSDTSLRAIVLGVLRDGAAPMRLPEVTQAALDRGWTTRSEHPVKLVGAALRVGPEFVSVSRGVYALRSDLQPAGADAPNESAGDLDETPMRSLPSALGSSNAADAKGAPLWSRIRDVLVRRNEPMRPPAIVEALVADGWTTAGTSPRNVVAAVLSSRQEFVAVARGLYGLRDTSELPRATSSIAQDEAETADLPVPDSNASASARESVTIVVPPLRVSRHETPALPPGVLRRSDPVAPDARVGAAKPALSSRYSPEVADVGEELDFLLQHVSDARADTAVLAPEYLRLQITAWIARARAFNDRARGHSEIMRATGRVAAELGDLCKRWWPGSVEAMRLDSRPQDALAPFDDETLDAAASTWSSVADRLDAQMTAAWSDPDFDDGWSDTRWLCRDERFVAERLAEADALLARIGTPLQQPPLRRAAELRLEPSDVSQLVRVARGLRWVRSVATDGLRWGLLIGRLRWIAATHPMMARSALGQVLAAEYQPLGGWGFDDVLRRERQELLTAELSTTSGPDLPAWINRAIDVFDNPELAKLLADRRADVASIDSSALASRRARGRIRKLATMMGVSVAESAPESAGPQIAAEAEAPEPQVESSESFASIRSALLERVGGSRALFISNREDTILREKLSTTFGLDLEWCVANPRRADAATDAIRRGRYDVILSATGFQDHTMDASFSRAAKDSSTLYVRVNRGRPAACARAIARELGVAAG